MDKEVPTKTQQQSELVLSRLRDDAVNGLVKEGREATFTSTATPTTDGLSVSTSNNKTQVKDQFEITGGNDEHYRPSASLSYTFGVGMSENADFQIVDGKKVENDNIKLATGLTISRNIFDENKGTVDLTKTDEAGKVLQTSHADYDRTFQQGNATEADWKVHDSKYGDVKINETVTGQPDGSSEYRGVIRDNDNHILGIIDQTYTMDQDGKLKTISTNARKSELQGQVVSPDD
jgi:hypothetical protein